MANGSLASINHVVLFMQENRAFDHYFGTMAGVRGFQDPNVQVNSGKPVWYQDVDKSLSNDTDYLLPWYLNYLGGDAYESTQCMTAGSNGWNDNHAALNGDLNNKWALNNTPYSWGHYKKSDLPVHFGIAEGWTVGDMYQQSVIASTSPNRVSWISGAINVPGGPQSPDEGGVYIDNSETPGCEGTNLNCYPLKWETSPEVWEAAGVSWQVYQDSDNFDDNPLAWFQQFQKASKSSSLAMRGTSFRASLDEFKADCANNTLPQISYIIGPAELSEHPPYQPKDGAWLQQEIVNALVDSPSYKDTALMISYDETGGWGDHVTPYHSPEGTAGEWLKDPYGVFGDVYSGPGFRLPFYIVSPWTRGGHVFTENSDHSSQIKFLEQWLAAKGYKNATTSQIPAWRRAHMSDLVKAFDFSKPDYSKPTITSVAPPSTTTGGNYNGYATCEATYPSPRPVVPYGKQTANSSLATEDGFKAVRGQLTEGRYLTLEMNGFALSNAKNSSLATTKATAQHDSKTQRFVLHQAQAGVNQYQLSSAEDGSYVGKAGALVKSASSAQTVVMNDLGNGKGYNIQNMGGSGYWAIDNSGMLSMTSGSSLSGFALFSVTYST